MKKQAKSSFMLLAALVLMCIGVSSCGSSSSQCPICGKTLTEETGQVKATLSDGRKVTVCSNCYAVGRMTGRCL